MVQRDIKAGQMVGQMFQDGCFDEELQYFGFAFWQKETVRFEISSAEELVYDFLAEKAAHGIVVTSVAEITRRLKLTPTEREKAELNLQEELKREIMRTYPPEYFAVLSACANEPNKSTAFNVLKHYRSALEANASEFAWSAFAGLVQMALTAKLLTWDDCGLLLKSLDASMSVIGNGYQAMAGIAYMDQHHQWQYFVNGYRPKIIEKKLFFYEHNILSTPILNLKLSGLQHQSAQAGNFRDEFLKIIPQVYDENYLAVLMQLQSLPAAINHDKFSEMLKSTSMSLSAGAMASIKRYKFLWHLH